MIVATVRVAEGGRIVIPTNVRAALGMEAGTEVVLGVEGRQLTLVSRRAARRRAQDRVARWVGGTRSMSAELIAERKRSALEVGSRP